MFAGTICSASQCAAESADCYSYGYGWFLQHQAFGTKLFPVVWHGGSVPGFAAYNSYHPDEKVTLIMLGNLETFASNQRAFAAQIVAMVIRGSS